MKQELGNKGWKD
jgi:hypothetical protein